MTSLFLGSGLGGGPPDFTGRGGADDSIELVDDVFAVRVSLPDSLVEGGSAMSTTANHKSWTSPERLSWNTMIAAVLDLVVCEGVCMICVILGIINVCHDYEEADVWEWNFGI